jgi:hypothetical protein
MGLVEHPTTQPSNPSSRRTATETSPSAKPPGTLNFEPLTLPGLVSVPALPVWLRKLLRRPTASH